ncbi:hypothetical protein JMJ55_22645 [Belnapia sp. T6]|uniref:Uncharacterized protein n=1 Tax=Belnapia mucosa TaxID=2804532 RepID=A0ABS1V8Z0_9PROT|nr:hypothetical protein [Belnapia mucosa]MBL6458141.1 hypothetical protein [Belnapia mucosa]
MTTPIAEDFAAIRARLDAIRAEERPVAAGPAPAAAPQAAGQQPGDFYSWLVGGTLWSVNS